MGAARLPSATEAAGAGRVTAGMRMRKQHITAVDNAWPYTRSAGRRRGPFGEVTNRQQHSRDSQPAT